MRMNGEKQNYQVCPLMMEASMTILQFFERDLLLIYALRNST